MTNATIAVGESHLDASRIYGLESTQLFLATYAEFDPIVHLETVKALRLAGGIGLSDALETGVTLLEQGRELEVSVDYRAGSEAVRTVLERHPGIAITGVRQLGTTLVVELGAVEVRDQAATDVTLATLDLALAAIPATEAVPAAVPAASPIRRSIPIADASRPLRILDQLLVPLMRLGRRQQILVLALLGIVAIALLVGALVVIDSSSDNTDAVILFSITLLGQLATGVAVLYVLRTQALQQKTQRNLHRRTRTMVDRRTAQLGHQGRRIREDLATFEALRDYVMELGRLQAEDVVRTEAALDRLGNRLGDR